jgi:3-hydroxyisobutyrate dehydrogenase
MASRTDFPSSSPVTGTRRLQQIVHHLGEPSHAIPVERTPECNNSNNSNNLDNCSKTRDEKPHTFMANTSERPDVAFIGLGAMGFGMATHLVAEGYNVTGFDVYGPTLERFQSAGGLSASSPSDAVANKSFCVCMVATAQQAQAVLFGNHAAVPSLPKGAALLLCSTVPASYVQGLQQQLKDLGRDDILLVDCPVSGGAVKAAQGTLSIMAAGSDTAISTSKALLEDLADPERLYVVAGGVGAGSNMKMVHQVLATNNVLAASEAMGLAQRLGLDLHKTADAVEHSNGRSWMFANRVPRMLEEKPQVASALTIILKDAGIITAESRRADFPTPMTTTAEQVYLSGLARGYGADDDSSMIRLYTEVQDKTKTQTSQTTVHSEPDRLALVVSVLEGVHLCAAAECIALADHVGLDLTQVLDLCGHAAGGSSVLDTFGPELASYVHRRSHRQGYTSGSLAGLAERLQLAVDEAQRLQVPLYLGAQALNLMRLKLTHRPKLAREPMFADIAWVWAA